VGIKCSRRFCQGGSRHAGIRDVVENLHFYAPQSIF
jgi:hypothetical protein